MEGALEGPPKPDSPETRAFAIVLLYVYVQTLPLVGDGDATWATLELHQALRRLIPWEMGIGKCVRMAEESR